MGELNFNSQICTTKEQSERLLALGLKKETADMHHCRWSEGYWRVEACPPRGDAPSFIPAWSLNRLVEMGFHKGIGIVVANNAYDSIISLIEKRIENGIFNKEYLCES